MAKKIIIDELKSRAELLDIINKFSKESSIELKVKDTKEYRNIQSFISKHRECFNKEVGMLYNKTTNIITISPERIRKRKNRQRCIGRLLSEIID